LDLTLTTTKTKEVVLLTHLVEKSYIFLSQLNSLYILIANINITEA